MCSETRRITEPSQYPCFPTKDPAVNAQFSFANIPMSVKPCSPIPVACLTLDPTHDCLLPPQGHDTLTVRSKLKHVIGDPPGRLTYLSYHSLTDKTWRAFLSVAVEIAGWLMSWDKRAAGEPPAVVGTAVLALWLGKTRKRTKAEIDYFLTRPCDDHGGSLGSFMKHERGIGAVRGGR